MDDGKEAAKATLKEGVRVLMRAYTASGNVSGMDWSVAREHSEGDMHVVGVEGEDGSLIAGDEVASAIAKHVALMDPRFMRMVLDMFRLASEEIDFLGPRSPVVDHAIRMADHLGRKWNEEVGNGQSQAARNR